MIFGDLTIGTTTLASTNKIQKPTPNFYLNLEFHVDSGLEALIVDVSFIAPSNRTYYY